MQLEPWGECAESGFSPLSLEETSATAVHDDVDAVAFEFQQIALNVALRGPHAPLVEVTDLEPAGALSQRPGAVTAKL